MVTLPPPQDLYHLPSPQDPYRPGPPQDAYRQASSHLQFNQPAPRQRTAIACRYCRRRKIRCSGFESSEDGRCTNCHRFTQECIFTPVSSQAQAFVPAHTAYPHLRNSGIPSRARQLQPQNPMLYGAHGQPLGGLPQQMTYTPDVYSLPNPHVALPSPTGPAQYRLGYDDGSTEQGSRKRPALEPPPSLLPPIPGAQSASGYPRGAGRRESNGNGDYQYDQRSDRSSLTLQPVSPASSNTSYQSYSHPPPQHAQSAYYSSDVLPPRRTSPGNQSSYSPSSQSSASIPSAYSYAAGLHPPMLLPAQGRTPPASAQGEATTGSRMSVQNMLETPPTRTPVDNTMLNSLLTGRGRGGQGQGPSK
ncbi:MAG: hypothetical protein M1829_004687 [Trizodia sp. TS-e1964]|nr:MAG: hypothetical protein M1829_004687 [Trizodia sp. TS-e1964]